VVPVAPAPPPAPLGLVRPTPLLPPVGLALAPPSVAPAAFPETPVIPEADTAALLVAGLIGLAACARWRSQAAGEALVVRHT
jgi:hypothetical protein